MTADKNKDRRKRDDSPDGPEQHDSSTEPVIRDKRRIDPETGEAREIDAPEGHLSDEDLAKLLEAPESEAATSSEHLEDLKRVQAEYANYRKRVDRDRHVARELAIVEVMTGFLPVLDDLDLAELHGDLDGSPLELVAQKMRALFERYGLEKVGEVGETFDPKLHEAIAQVPDADAESETIVEVVRPGYLLGERLLRAAKVAVSVPGD